MSDKFDQERSGTGTKEWAETTENITIGCPNGCLYCYAAYNADRFGYRKRSEWTREEFNKRAGMKSYSAKGGVVMFPSSHDITPFNVDEYIRVALLILEAGNQLLIVSKPRIECVEKMLTAFRGYEGQILFRFSITTMSEHATLFFEPGASMPWERVTCLELVRNSCFETSVSIEPLLGGRLEARAIVSMVDRYVTKTIWIGKMNKPRLRVDMKIPENCQAVEAIEQMQSDAEIMKIVSALNFNSKIRWKDSIKEVIERVRRQVI